jgi:hypothetical protein
VIAGALARLGTLQPPKNPHALARAILAERRFMVRVARPVQRTWWDVALQWLADRWNDLVHALSRNVHVGSKGSVVAGDLLLAVAVLLVVIVAIRLVAGLIKENAPAHVRAELTTPSSWEELYAESLEAAQREEYRVAITLLFRAALCALDVRGVLHDDPARTIGEWRREVCERAPRRIPAFDRMARVFSGVIYGDMPASASLWDEARAAYDSLFAGSGEHAA